MIKKKNHTTIRKVCICGCGREKDFLASEVKRGFGMYYSRSCKNKHAAHNREPYQPQTAIKMDSVGMANLLRRLLM